MPVVGLLQSLELNQTSGCIRIRCRDRGGSVWLEKGRPVHATFAGVKGPEAVYRMLAVDDGTFRVDFGTIPGDEGTIQQSLAGLLLEGARRCDDTQRLWASLPPRDHVVIRVTSDGSLTADDYTLILRCDGRRTLEEVVDGSDDALATLESMHRLWKEGALEVVRPSPHPVQRAEEGGPRTDKIQVREALEPERADPEPVPRRRYTARWMAAGLTLAGAAAAAAIVMVGPTPATEPAAPIVAEAPALAPIQVAAPAPLTCPPSMAKVDSGDGAAFCMDTHEVTVEAYARCVKKGECLRAHRTSDWPQGETKARAWARAKEAYGELCNAGVEGREDHPVNCVTWEQANQYCRWADKRLPTDAQWERAAGADDARRYPWGDDAPGSDRGNFCGPECRSWKLGNGLRGRVVMAAKADDFAGTAPVGSYPEAASPFGVLDMAGNVFEWTADEVEVEDGDDAVAHVRGGSFGTVLADGVEITSRSVEARSTYVPSVGFRCAAALR